MKTSQISALPARVVRAGEGECLELPGEIRHILLDGAATGDVFSLARTQLSAGDGESLHLHTREDELFWIERGEFDMCVGDQTTVVRAGDFVFAPRGVPHSYACRNEHGALLVITSGAGLENFFRKIAAAHAIGAPLNDEQTRELAATFGLYSDDFDRFAASENAPAIVRADGGERLEAFGDTVRVLLATSTTNNRVCFAEGHTPSLSGPPPHVHEREDETFVILAGRYEFSLDDARVQVGVGDVVWAPRGKPHTFHVVSSEPGCALILATPGGFDNFFRSAAVQFANGTATPQSLGELGARHGIRFLAPGE